MEEMTMQLSHVQHDIQDILGGRNTTQQRRPPPPAFVTTSTKTIDFSIGFRFAALIYVSLEIFREFYVIRTHTYGY
jgi:hypothetical protein